VAADLGSYLMAAVPNATIVGFTGTPVGSSKDGSGSFQIFGAQDEDGYLDKYSDHRVDHRRDDRADQVRARSLSMRMSSEDLDEQFFALADEEEITDIDELTRGPRSSGGAAVVFWARTTASRTSPRSSRTLHGELLPLGYKAFVVAVDREACAKYKRALDRHLPPEWSEAVYSDNPTTLSTARCRRAPAFGDS